MLTIYRTYIRALTELLANRDLVEKNEKQNPTSETVLSLEKSKAQRDYGGLKKSASSHNCNHCICQTTRAKSHTSALYEHLLAIDLIVPYCGSTKKFSSCFTAAAILVRDFSRAKGVEANLRRNLLPMLFENHRIIRPRSWPLNIQTSKCWKLRSCPWIPNCGLTRSRRTFSTSHAANRRHR